MQQDVPTLKSCWDQGKNVIVSYDYPSGQHPEMWGRIPYFYGNSMDPVRVESKLCHYLEKPRPTNGEPSFYGCRFLIFVKMYETQEKIFTFGKDR